MALNVRHATDRMMNGNVELQPKYVKFDLTAPAGATLVSAVAGKKIRVVSYTIVHAGNSIVSSFLSNASAISSAFPLLGGIGISSCFNPCGHFETVSGEPLAVGASGAGGYSGHVTYVEV